MKISKFCIIWTLFLKMDGSIQNLPTFCHLFPNVIHCSKHVLSAVDFCFSYSFGESPPVPSMQMCAFYVKWTVFVDCSCIPAQVYQYNTGYVWYQDFFFVSLRMEMDNMMGKDIYRPACVTAVQLQLPLGHAAMGWRAVMDPTQHSPACQHG